MGLQIPRCVHPEVPETDALRGAAEVFGRGVSQACRAKGEPDLARVYGERKRNFVGQHFWARGYFVSTVGRDEEVIRQYIQNQEAEDKRLDQMRLWN